MPATTKIYKNTTKQTINVVGVGELEPGAQVSITSDFHAVNLALYPGVVDVLEEEAKAAEEKKDKK